MSSNTPMIMMGVMIVTVLIAFGTGVFTQENFNIQPNNSSDTTSNDMEERNPLSDSLQERIEELTETTNAQMSFSLVAFIILIIVLIMIWTLAGLRRASRLDKRLDELDHDLISSLDRTKHESKAIRDELNSGRYSMGTRYAPKKRVREIYGMETNPDKIVNDLIETGGFNPRELKRKQSIHEDEPKIYTVLCPKCKKVHIQTDEEGCWFCGYKWGDKTE